MRAGKKGGVMQILPLSWPSFPPSHPPTSFSWHTCLVWPPNTSSRLASACGATDIRKSLSGLILWVGMQCC